MCSLLLRPLHLLLHLILRINEVGVSIPLTEKERLRDIKIAWANKWKTFLQTSVSLVLKCAFSHLELPSQGDEQGEGVLTS